VGGVATIALDGCTACGACVLECPEKALAVSAAPTGARVTLSRSRCAGVTCRRCERCCEERVLELDRLLVAPED